MYPIVDSGITITCVLHIAGGFTAALRHLIGASISYVQTDSDVQLICADNDAIRRYADALISVARKHKLLRAAPVALPLTTPLNNFLKKIRSLAYEYICRILVVCGCCDVVMCGGCGCGVLWRFLLFQ